jgi:hypothetical protein
LIRIISTPPVEAARSIREVWVGLELPFASLSLRRLQINLGAVTL